MDERLVIWAVLFVMARKLTFNVFIHLRSMLSGDKIEQNDYFNR